MIIFRIHVEMDVGWPGLPDDFQTKNPNLDKFWRVLQWKMLEYLMAIWYIYRPFGIFYGSLIYFVVIWHIFPNEQRKIWQP
jgi:hypothetical protein